MFGCVGSSTAFGHRAAQTGLTLAATNVGKPSQARPTLTTSVCRQPVRTFSCVCLQGPVGRAGQFAQFRLPTKLRFQVSVADHADQQAAKKEFSPCRISSTRNGISNSMSSPSEGDGSATQLDLRKARGFLVDTHTRTSSVRRAHQAPTLAVFSGSCSTGGSSA